MTTYGGKFTANIPVVVMDDDKAEGEVTVSWPFAKDEDGVFLLPNLGAVYDFEGAVTDETGKALSFQNWIGFPKALKAEYEGNKVFLPGLYSITPGTTGVITGPDGTEYPYRVVDFTASGMGGYRAKTDSVNMVLDTSSSNAYISELVELTFPGASGFDVWTSKWSELGFGISVQSGDADAVYISGNFIYAEEPGEVDVIITANVSSEDGTPVVIHVVVADEQTAEYAIVDESGKKIDELVLDRDGKVGPASV
ncbi:MAG: hypothetical protein Q4C54_08835 [Clostridia bacterium]|nr:hypothetical protein [Clostridia bacterium]